MLVRAASFVKILSRMAKANCTQDLGKIFMPVTLWTLLSTFGVNETEGPKHH